MRNLHDNPSIRVSAYIMLVGECGGHATRQKKTPQWLTQGFVIQSSRGGIADSRTRLRVKFPSGIRPKKQCCSSNATGEYPFRCWFQQEAATRWRCHRERRKNATRTRAIRGTSTRRPCAVRSVQAKNIFFDRPRREQSAPPTAVPYTSGDNAAPESYSTVPCYHIILGGYPVAANLATTSDPSSCLA